MNPENQDSFENQLRTTLRQSEQQVDTRMQARLAAARREVLEQNPPKFPLSFGVPVWGSLAAAMVIAVVIIRVNAPVTDRPVTDALTAEQQLEIYENLEMLEFFDELDFADELGDEPAEEIAS